ncbi:hypothetical protein SADUNF_Sadunf16G0181200 [Salix dunnii]|uniref:Uncharacterized protein n=1 Tax=Salix dunnii TaxID=1413687 RepID=A0A835MQK8_9ROSI|nr:hypothetical protein SADUNF_Sadunf16G0181200 [Salix dunnii]
MGGELKSVTVFSVLLLSLLLSIMVYGTGARPLSSSRLSKDVNAGETEGLVGGFSLLAVKNSGPSPGIGHKYKNLECLGEATKSGPSPGQGHRHVTNGEKIIFFFLLSLSTFQGSELFLYVYYARVSCRLDMEHELM